MLVGVIHLPPLPGSPGFAVGASLGEVTPRIDAVTLAASNEAALLGDAGFDGIVVENFGDAPFFAGRVPAVTVACMARVAEAVRRTAPSCTVCVNVLRNDGDAALAVAAATGAQAIRVNVLVGARVTDQGIVEGHAAELMRTRAALGLSPVRPSLAGAAQAGVEVWADADVKHSAPLGSRENLHQEVEDLLLRAGAARVIVTGDGTGKGVDLTKLQAVRRAARGAPVMIGSGATLATLDELLQHADDIIVGSALRPGGRAGTPIDAKLAREFARAYRAARSSRPRASKDSTTSAGIVPARARKR